MGTALFRLVAQSYGTSMILDMGASAKQVMYTEYLVLEAESEVRLEFVDGLGRSLSSLPTARLARIWPRSEPLL